MIGGLPESTARGIAESAMFGLEVMAAISVFCEVGAGVCFILARHATGTPAPVLRWASLLLAVAALGPPVLVAWAINH